MLTVRPDDRVLTQVPVYEQQTLPLVLQKRTLSVILLLAMLCATVLLYAVLPLRGLYFYLSFPNTRFESWLLLPTHLLFPGVAMSLAKHYPPPATRSLAWKETTLLMASIIAVFGCYLLALRLLPRRITPRYILVTTLLLGLLFVLFPAMTSQDVFSYIAYARMAVIYHLNPLVATPTAIAKDPVYPYVFWTNQPSIYGPTWVIITSAMQWVTLTIGLKSILSMIVLLRLLGLATHLVSTQLIWLMSGSLQQLTGRQSLRTRLLATLAFAWNPLLLYEACTSAHNDTPMLFLVLLAIWFLLPDAKNRPRSYVVAAALLAVATCLKLNIIVLFPLVVLFLWKRDMPMRQRIQHVVFSVLTYAVVVVFLYAPFWQSGAASYVIRVNPGTIRDINSPYEFLTHLYESLRHRRFAIVLPDVGTSIEKLTHLASFALFSVLYGAYCVYALLARRALTTLPSLIRVMALAWLLYCFLGSPWLWPWYFVTFFGLFALVEAVETSWQPLSQSLQLSLMVRSLAFTLLALYCLDTWGPIATFVSPLYYFQVTYLRGLWLCVFPLLTLCVLLLFRQRQRLSLRQDVKVGLTARLFIRSVPRHR